MRALILSDIHANLEALNAVLDHADALAPAHHVLWNLGDTVGYGGSPNQVIDRVRPISALTVRGNHDRVCCGSSSPLNFNPVARAAVEWTKAELTSENIRWLRELGQGPLHPQTAHASPTPVASEVLLAAASADRGDTPSPFASVPNSDPKSTAVACAHGSPIHEDHYIVSLRDAWAPLQQMLSPLTFFGHTHIQGGFGLYSNPGHPTNGASPTSRSPAKPPGEWREVRPHFFSRSRAESWSVRLSPHARYLLNPGSVGQPRDGDWRAACALYDDEASEITFYRVPYDVTAAQGRILMAGLPERLAARLRDGQ